MYFIAFSGRFKLKLVIILSAVLISILSAVLLWAFSSVKSAENASYSFDLTETKGVAGFLSQFLLDYDSLQNEQEVTLPPKDDEVFAQYNELQSKIGLNVLKFSGKKVHQRYLKLKNKTKSGQTLYGVLYIYKEKVIACHLTTLVEGSQLMPITAFG